MWKVLKNSPNRPPASFYLIGGIIMTSAWKRILTVGFALCLLLCAVPMKAAALEQVDASLANVTISEALKPEMFSDNRTTMETQLRKG